MTSASVFPGLLILAASVGLAFSLVFTVIELMQWWDRRKNPQSPRVILGPLLEMFAKLTGQDLASTFSFRATQAALRMKTEHRCEPVPSHFAYQHRFDFMADLAEGIKQEKEAESARALRMSQRLPEDEEIR